MGQGADSDGVSQTIVIVGKRPGSSGDLFAGVRRYLAFLSMTALDGAQGDFVTAAPDDKNQNPNCENNPSSGNPVILSTGEKYAAENDFSAQGLYGLSMTRTHHSNGTIAGMFGRKWSGSLEPPVLVTAGCRSHSLYPGVCIPDRVSYNDPTGASFTYTRQGGVGLINQYKVGQSLDAGVLTFDLDANAWTLKKRAATYHFNGDRVLELVTTIDGNELTYEYTAPGGRLSRVVNRVGQDVLFTWGAYSGQRVSTIRDSGGNTWTYAYNANGMLISATAPGSTPAIKNYYYENTADSALLTGIGVNGARYSTYSYDASKRVTQVTHTGGELNDTFQYLQSPQRTVVTDVRGQATTYTYTQSAGVAKLSGVSRAATSTCPAMAASTVRDASGWIDYTLDWNGNKTDRGYDAAGRLTYVSVAAGTAIAKQTLYNWLGDDLYEVTELGGTDNTVTKRTSYSYETPNGLLSEVKVINTVTGEQRRRTFTYTRSFGALSSITETEILPGGNAVTITNFDAKGNIASIVNPLGHTTLFSAYNGLGLPGQVVDANGVVSTFAHHPNGTLASSTRTIGGVGRTTTYAYDRMRNVTDIAYPDGRVTRLRYKNFDRLESIGNALSEFVTTAFDTTTLKYTTSAARHVPTLSGTVPAPQASGQFTSHMYVDSLGRVRQQAGNNGQQVNLSYDGNGNVKTRTDAAGRQTKYDYDVLNRLSKITAPDGGITLFGYDIAGNLATVTDPRNLTTTYLYNFFGQVTQRTSPDTGVTGYAYDASGRLSTETRANGSAVTYTWDKLGRMTSRTSAGVTESFTYDEGAYGKGRLTRLNDATGSTSYSYNADGSLASQTNTLFGSVFTTSWGYNAAGQLSSMSYPNGTVLSYSYDAYGRLARVGSNIAGWGTLADSFLHQPATDMRYAWRFGNNLPRTATPHPTNRWQRPQPELRLEHHQHFGVHHRQRVRRPKRQLRLRPG
jgi:YD repeat-containing protein